MPSSNSCIEEEARFDTPGEGLPCHISLTPNTDPRTPTPRPDNLTGHYYRALALALATRSQKRSAARPKPPSPPPALPAFHPSHTRHIETTMDTSSSTRPSWVNNTPLHAHTPLQSQQLPPGGAPIVMESLKLQVEEEREYYSVIAALPGVRKQGECGVGGVDLVYVFKETPLSAWWPPSRTVPA